MTTLFRSAGLLGIAAVGGSILLVANLGFVTPSAAQSPLDVAATQERSLTFHTAGIQKALQGDYLAAIVDYDQALQLSPSNPEIYYNRAVAHYSVGNSEQALQDFGRAIQLQPTMAEAYANRSTIHLEMGDSARAVSDGETAATLFDQQGQPQLAEEIRDWLRQQSIPSAQ